MVVLIDNRPADENRNWRRAVAKNSSPKCVTKIPAYIDNDSVWRILLGKIDKNGKTAKNKRRSEKRAISPQNSKTDAFSARKYFNGAKNVYEKCPKNQILRQNRKHKRKIVLRNLFKVGKSLSFRMQKKQKKELQCLIRITRRQFLLGWPNIRQFLRC